MPTVARLKELKRTIIESHVRRDDLKGLVQVLTTLLPLGGLWYAAVLTTGASQHWLTVGVVVLMSLFLLRVFVLMHECGHRSLFQTNRLNRTFGFLFGALSGMPQYVWSQHHQHHHSTNGNWDRYRGPMNIIPVDEYAAMTHRQQRRYRNARSVWLAPVAGFVYLILNPRITWLRGSVGLVRHIIVGKVARPDMAINALAREFETPYWSSMQEYRHMFWNNVVLMTLLVAMASAIGPMLFFPCWIASASLAGGAGILLFTVQHNFEHSYASCDEGWDYDDAAIMGTSFLVLPRWLNWFTANIAYHHIHHLSARIPNYCLMACHDEHQHLFSDVKRISLAEIPRALGYILWDTRSRRIVSVAEVQQQAVARSASTPP